jgi:hypothetical protein
MKNLTRFTGRPLAAGTLIAATLIASPFAVAATGSALREGLRNGTAVKETEVIGRMHAQTGKGGYVTRQSNISTGASAGGGAVYGCRTPAGGTAAGTAPCLRGSNLAGGNAFEFATSGGPAAGRITVGDPSVANPGAPFTTNATGVATGLNADQVDGKHASELLSPVRVAAATGPVQVATCTAFTIGSCADIASRTLGAGNWLVQAKLVVANAAATASSPNDRCGLAQGTTVLDESRHSLQDNSSNARTESLALTAVVSGVADGTTIGLRCTEQGAEDLRVEDVKITALQVSSVTGP